jgi:hypothetical protein
MKFGDEIDAFSRWRRALCVFHNNTGLVKDAQRRYQKRVREAARREIENEVSNL